MTTPHPDPTKGWSTAQLEAAIPLTKTLGIELLSATREQVVGQLECARALSTATGRLHGGALTALADTVGAVVAFLNLPEDTWTSTTTSSTVFLRGVRRGIIVATARPLHVGRQSIVVVTDVTDLSGRPVAQVTQTLAVLGVTAPGLVPPAPDDTAPDA